MRATLNTTATSWEVNLKTSIELYIIWEMTGVLDQLEGIDENLFDVITDIIDEKREDYEDWLEEQDEADDDDALMKARVKQAHGLVTCLTEDDNVFFPSRNTTPLS